MIDGGGGGGGGGEKRKKCPLALPAHNEKISGGRKGDGTRTVWRLQSNYRGRPANAIFARTVLLIERVNNLIIV